MPLCSKSLRKYFALLPVRILCCLGQEIVLRSFTQPLPCRKIPTVRQSARFSILVNLYAEYCSALHELRARLFPLFLSLCQFPSTLRLLLCAG